MHPVSLLLTGLFQVSPQQIPQVCPNFQKIYSNRFFSLTLMGHTSIGYHRVGFKTCTLLWNWQRKLVSLIHFCRVRQGPPHCRHKHRQQTSHRGRSLLTMIAWLKVEPNGMLAYDVSYRVATVEYACCRSNLLTSVRKPRAAAREHHDHVGLQVYQWWHQVGTVLEYALV